ncbi:Peptidase inhibitor 15 [Pteropus alecto]|uniref:Peptidase inhibitor 15 n=1 Tax=Pteropus alecto TaxID=9402 RepID=L5JSY1_PTEAL|nr:Peptidase inhibitor 15 [Pteropus alecto]
MTAISAVSSAVLLSLLCEASAVVLLNSTDSSSPTNNFTDIEAALTAQLDSADIPKARRKRYISQNDMIAILDYHNQVRGKVFPPAANMEYMVWDENLAKSAEAWAATCIWDHGPSYLLRFLGQNLSVRTGRYRSILQLVKPWYDEVKDYAFPYPQDCNPRCPMRGNWIGEAPYKVGVPCSACPPSYGASCTDNLCFPGVTSNYLYWFK